MISTVLGGPGAPVSFGGWIVKSLASTPTFILRLGPREAAIDAGLSILAIAIAIGATRGLEWLLGHGAKRLVATGLVEPDEASKGPRVAALTWSLIKLVITLVAGLAILEIWGIDPLGWLSGSSGATITRIALLIPIAVGVLEVTAHILRQMFHTLEARSGDPRRAAQFRTLAPIVIGLVRGLLIILIGLTVLSEIGLKIGPLLAGAGVVGVALGFGAQTLVKDFLTGLFLILEDVVSVGDNVKIGDSSGTVEVMTLRTIRLRDFDGTLHVLPYSEAQVVHNRTKSFSNYVFEPRISYISDLRRARDVMQQVGEELRGDPRFAHLILEPLEIVGVDAFTDVGVVLKARFKTQPGQQWRVGREFNLRIKTAFDKENIEIGYPQVQADRNSTGDDAAEQTIGASEPARQN